MLLPIKIGDWLVGEQRAHLQFLLDGKYAVVDLRDAGATVSKV